MFIDIALTYALLNFVIAIVLGKYFERKGERY
jgi:multisubunit Na+/H+ antiporter MnhF subunit